MGVPCVLQERKVLHTESGVPQDVAKRDALPGEHQQDRQGR